MRTCFALIAAIALTPLVAGAEPVSWHDYVVPESGAIAQIPADVFPEDGGKPESGYGRRFFTADRRADLTVQSIPNDANDTPASFLAKKRPPSDIVYKRVTSRFFVVSSYRENKIWYDRCNFAAHFVNCVLINYPAVEKRQWDGVITRISNTLASR
jgi:hypothetical protein